jgi:hypothetical protein
VEQGRSYVFSGLWGISLRIETQGNALLRANPIGFGDSRSKHGSYATFVGWNFFGEAVWCVFYWGFLRKRVFGCGFWVVNLWWNRGELWSVDGHFLRAKNLPRILNLFFGIPVLELVELIVSNTPGFTLTLCLRAARKKIAFELLNFVAVDGR